MSRRGRGASWRFGVGGLLAGLALSWALGGRGLTAQAVPKPRPDAETIAFTTNGPGGTLLYLVDAKEKAFAIYRFDPAKDAIKLVAARPYQWDLRLEYNNLPPEVRDVEKLVTQAQAGR